MPLVSVIIPVYQVKEYLLSCVNSVCNQTYKEIEIILVDDGSTDGSAELCDLIKLQDCRIKVIHQKNRGLSSARNAGIEVSSGNYITFVDSDDVVANVMIEEMVDLAIKENADVVKIGVIRKYNESENIPVKKSYSCYTGLQALNLVFCSNPQIICGCGKLFSRTVLGDTRFPNGKYYEDEYFTPRIYSKAQNVVLCDSEYYFYMQRDNDSILRGKLNQKKIRDSIWISEDRIQYFRSCGYRTLECKATIDLLYKIDSLIHKIDEDCNDLILHEKEYLLRAKKRFIKEHFWLYSYVLIKRIAYNIYKILKKGKC